MLEPYAFAKLIHPITPEEFWAEYWEKKALVVHRDDPDYYKELLDLESVNEAITGREDFHDNIFMGNHEREVKKENYTFPSGLIDLSKLYAEFADGSSIALNHLHDRVASLSNLCRSLEAELSMRFQTNIYFTPPDAQCFPPHYDSHCVFALQCAGAKQWRLYDFPLELPLHTQGFVQEKIEIGPTSQEFVLKAGDFVYCPRGLGHDADTKGQDEVSLHITVGVMQLTWTNVILEAMARVSLEDPKLRGALPIGFARPDFDRVEARATYEKIVGHLVEQMNCDKAFDFFIDDIIATRHPLLPGQFEQIQKLPGLKHTDRTASRRPNLMYRIEHDGDESIKLLVYGREITLPEHAEEPLRYALAHDGFSIASLPGELDDPGKLVLIRRLVREGLVYLH